MQDSCGNIAHPKLPPELECSIFVLAYHSDQRDVRHLLLVAKRVFHWLISIIYNDRTVIFDHRMVPHPPIAAFRKYGHHVRHLYLDAQYHGDHGGMDAILAACPNVFDLGCGNKARLTQEAFNHPIKRLSLMRLSLFQEAHKASPNESLLTNWCSNVTHLSICTDLHSSNCQSLMLFPNLTHFSLFAWNNHSVVPEILRLSPQLQVVVYLWVSDTTTECTKVISGPTSLFQDPRVVEVDYFFPEDWKRSAREDDDIWAMAEREVRRRQSTGKV
ncbi:hypothetical protein BDN72DRAFT_834202 [Pluteus cervinus]|uniref:Uncharacterized protein n=1 Tax=Pluteus cervinus TaxID=181527 RepID=A0ACD3B798_9AGAR|nr:hypothetical protein BDN72DRAFT_834202 [Pluteus cervinus]